MPIARNTNKGSLFGKKAELSSNNTMDPESLNGYSGIFYLGEYETPYLPWIYAKTSATTALADSLQIDTPACSPGDLLLVFGVVKFSTQIWQNEGGWTLENQSNETPNLAVYSRIADGNETSTYTFGASGGPNAIVLVAICIRNWISFNVGSFGGRALPPTIPVPNDASNQKLLLFFIGNDGNGRSWDITGITEFEISLVNTDASLDLSAIYRLSPNTFSSYTTTQTGGGSNSHGLTIVVK